ncbi:hypothetical protein NN3_00340 [Nocardia neocaledoniensis NBRC 108232]|nr:hypothetical protein NN3_00340 [Nocardia neocaledoniensis NBRC 108232]
MDGKCKPLHAFEKGHPVDPIVIASYINAGLALLSNGLALAGNVLNLALHLL